MTVNEFLAHTSDPAGQLYDCPYSGGTSNLACNQWTGRYILEVLEIPFSDVRRPLLIMLGFLLAFFLGSGVIFWLRPIHMGISRARETDTDFSAGKERMSTCSLEEASAINIQLHDFKLEIRKRGFNFWKPKTLSILKPLVRTYLLIYLELWALLDIYGPNVAAKVALIQADKGLVMWRGFVTTLKSKAAEA